MTTNADRSAGLNKMAAVGDNIQQSVDACLGKDLDLRSDLKIVSAAKRCDVGDDKASELSISPHLNSENEETKISSLLSPSCSTIPSFLDFAGNINLNFGQEFLFSKSSAKNSAKSIFPDFVSLQANKIFCNADYSIVPSANCTSSVKNQQLADHKLLKRPVNLKHKRQPEQLSSHLSSPADTVQEPSRKFQRFADANHHRRTYRKRGRPIVAAGARRFYHHHFANKADNQKFKQIVAAGGIKQQKRRMLSSVIVHKREGHPASFESMRSENVQLQCGNCALSFESEERLKLHEACCNKVSDWRLRQENQRLCFHCNQEFDDVTSLQQHVQTAHQNAKMHVCSECGKSFATSSGLKQHAHIHASIKPFTCEVCYKSYTQFSNLCRHKRMHVDCRNQLKCKACGQKFSTITAISKHQRFCNLGIRASAARHAAAAGTSPGCGSTNGNGHVPLPRQQESASVPSIFSSPHHPAAEYLSYLRQGGPLLPPPFSFLSSPIHGAELRPGGLLAGQFAAGESLFGGGFKSMSESGTGGAGCSKNLGSDGGSSPESSGFSDHSRQSIHSSTKLPQGVPKAHLDSTSSGGEHTSNSSSGSPVDDYHNGSFLPHSRASTPEPGHLEGSYSNPVKARVDVGHLNAKSPPASKEGTIAKEEENEESESEEAENALDLRIESKRESSGSISCTSISAGLISKQSANAGVQNQSKTMEENDVSEKVDKPATDSKLWFQATKPGIQSDENPQSHSDSSNEASHEASCSSTSPSPADAMTPTSPSVTKTPPAVSVQDSRLNKIDKQRQSFLNHSLESLLALSTAGGMPGSNLTLAKSMMITPVASGHQTGFMSTAMTSAPSLFDVRQLLNNAALSRFAAAGFAAARLPFSNPLPMLPPLDFNSQLLASSKGSGVIKELKVTTASSAASRPGSARESNTATEENSDEKFRHQHSLPLKSKDRYSCRYCGKIFPRSANLTRHLRTHTGEQPYKCQYCERSFSISSNLQRHVRNIHNREKPFRCHLCERCFGQQTNLDRHLKKHEFESARGSGGGQERGDDSSGSADEDRPPMPPPFPAGLLRAHGQFFGHNPHLAGLGPFFGGGPVPPRTDPASLLPKGEPPDLAFQRFISATAKDLMAAAANANFLSSSSAAAMKFHGNFLTH